MNKKNWSLIASLAISLLSNASDPRPVKTLGRGSLSLPSRELSDKEVATLHLEIVRQTVINQMIMGTDESSRFFDTHIIDNRFGDVVPSNKYETLRDLIGHVATFTLPQSDNN